jgi:hypothetical protein
MDNEIGKWEKGEISSFEEDGSKARILVKRREEYVTKPLIIPWYLLGELGDDLQVGDTVAFVEFYDFTGIVTHRMDSRGGRIFPWEVKSKVDFISDDVSGKHHVHPGVETGAGKTEEPEGEDA